MTGSGAGMTDGIRHSCVEPALDLIGGRNPSPNQRMDPRFREVDGWGQESISAFIFTARAQPG